MSGLSPVPPCPRAFEIFHAFDLLMAQPSLCDSHMVFTQWGMLFQRPENMLRYVTFIEIMVRGGRRRAGPLRARLSRSWSSGRGLATRASSSAHTPLPLCPSQAPIFQMEAYNSFFAPRRGERCGPSSRRLGALGE